jgi:hypothetical protein
MSMRYAETTENSNVPAMPSLAEVGRPPSREDDSVRSRTTSATKENPREADKKLLDQENFDPDACEPPVFWPFWLWLSDSRWQT